jgi:hypothetical protein
MVIIIYSIRWWFDDFLNEHIVYIIYLILLRILYDDHFRSENKGVGIPHLWTKSGWDLLDSDSRVGHDNHPFCLDAHVHTKHKQQWSISPTCRILQMVRYGLLLRPFSNMFFFFLLSHLKALSSHDLFIPILLLVAKKGDTTMNSGTAWNWFKQRIGGLKLTKPVGIIWVST